MCRAVNNCSEQMQRTCCGGAYLLPFVTRGLLPGACAVIMARRLPWVSAAACTPVAAGSVVGVVVLSPVAASAFAILGTAADAAMLVKGVPSLPGCWLWR